jgi:two-component system phosphate regulon response regulator PhoB
MLNPPINQLPRSIMIVDDDEDIRELLRHNLAKQGFRVISAEDGEAAFKAISGERPDLIVLDLMMPNIDGLALTRILRANKETARIPILMLTARGEESDIITGLELGADDYMIKPFSIKVLLARIDAILRRASTKSDLRSDETVAPKDVLILNHDTFHAEIASESLDLTATEFRILEALQKKPGRVLTRTQIVDAARGEDYAVTDRSVDVHIVSLRKKLGRYGSLIETIRGVGYRLKEHA